MMLNVYTRCAREKRRLRQYHNNIIRIKTTNMMIIILYLRIIILCGTRVSLL